MSGVKDKNTLFPHRSIDFSAFAGRVIKNGVGTRRGGRL